jgi:Flp pilus assembly protein TadG
MVEFTLVLLPLCLILLAILQLGIVFKNYVTLTDAVRAAARKAAVSRHNPSAVLVVKDALVNSASGLDATELRANTTVTATPWAPGTDVTVRATYHYDINLLGLVLKSGRMSSQTTERVE